MADLGFVRGFVHYGLIPYNIPSLVGKPVAVLSILALSQQVYDVGLHQVLQSLIETFGSFLTIGFRPIEPLISYVLSPFTGIGIVFNPDNPVWRHVVVLFSIYVVQSALLDFKMGRKYLSLLDFIWGMTLAIPTGVLVGQLSTSDFATQSIVAALPTVAALYLYDLGRAFASASSVSIERRLDLPPRTGQRVDDALPDLPYLGWWGELRYAHKTIFIRTIGAVLVSITAIALLPFENHGQKVIATVGIATIYYAVFWLFWARVVTRHNVAHRRGGLTPRHYWDTASARLGAAIIGTFIWAIVTIVVEVGLHTVVS